MILNFNSTLYATMYTAFCIQILTCLGFKNFSYIFLLDLPNRLFMDDYYFNVYYFTWTNLWYLGFFAPSIFLARNLYRNYRLFALTTVSGLLLIVFYATAYDYWWINLVAEWFTLDKHNFNTLLLNSLNKYHPCLLYLSLSIFTIGILFTKAYLYPSHHYFSGLITNRTFLCLLKSLAWLNLFTLILGGWWAFQEGSWGGWWNWDASEIFGLYIAIQIIFFFHLKDLTTNFRFIFYYLTRAGSLLAIFYFFMQLNFNLISHNFGFRSTYFLVDFNYIFTLLTAALTASYTSFTIKTHPSLTIFRLTLLASPRLPLFLLLQLCLIYVLLLLTVLLLVNNFSFLYFDINLINMVVSFKTLTYFNFILLYISSWGLISYIHFLVPTTLIFSYSIYLLSLLSVESIFFWKSRLVGVTHLLTLFLVFISYLFSTKVFLYWSESSWGFKSLLAGSKFSTYIYISTLQLGTPLIEYQFLATEPIAYDYNYGSSAGNNKTFSLPLSAYLAFQQLISGEYEPFFTSTMYDPSLFPISFIIMLLSYIIFLLIRINFTLEK